MFTPYVLVTDPELIRKIFIEDFKTFKNNGFKVSFFVQEKSNS